jgi:hypothetical protein
MTSIQFDTALVSSIGSKNYLMIELHGYEENIKARKFVSELKGKFVAELKRFRLKRSLDSNAYFWLLCGKLAAVIKQPSNEIYRGYIKNIGDNFEVIPVRADAVNKLISVWESKGLGFVADIIGESKISGYVNVRIFYGSSTYNTDQMSRLIELLVFDCQEQGIQTKTPAELERMNLEWQQREQKH